MAQRGRPQISEAEALRRIDNAINAANKRAARTFKSLGPGSSDYQKIEAYLSKIATNYGFTIKRMPSGAIQLARRKAEMNFVGNTTAAAQMNRWFEANYKMGEHKKELESLAKRQFYSKPHKNHTKLSRDDIAKAIKGLAELQARNQQTVRENLETLYAYEGKGIEGVDDELAKWKQKGRKSYDRINNLAKVAQRAKQKAQSQGITHNDMSNLYAHVEPGTPIDLNDLYDAIARGEIV